MPLVSQFMVGEESTYATAVTVATACEFTEENIVATPGRVRVMTRRTGTNAVTRRGDRTLPYLDGASGSVSMPILSKGHGKLLKWAMGTVSTGSLVDSSYTHTYTLVPGGLTGDFFTAQADRPFHASGTSQAFTWAGGKITTAEWSISTGDDGYLKATYGMDFATETTGTALATPSYATATPLAWPSATLTFGGAAIELVEGSISLSNALKLDRKYVRASTTKKEPLENGPRTVTFSFTCDFDSLTHYNRVVGTTQAATVASVVLTVPGPTLIGVSTYPSMTFTIPEAEFDAVSGVSVTSDDPIRATFTGEATWNGSASPLTIAYVSTDATP